mgnify:FL=1
MFVLTIKLQHKDTIKDSYKHKKPAKLIAGFIYKKTYYLLMVTTTSSANMFSFQLFREQTNLDRPQAFPILETPDNS